MIHTRYLLFMQIIVFSGRIEYIWMIEYLLSLLLMLHIFIVLKDEDPFYTPKYWKPPLPDLSPEMAEDADSACPCPTDYTQVLNYSIYRLKHFLCYQTILF